MAQSDTELVRAFVEQTRPRLSQADAAALVGADQRTVSRWELALKKEGATINVRSDYREQMREYLIGQQSEPFRAGVEMAIREVREKLAELEERAGERRAVDVAPDAVPPEERQGSSESSASHTSPTTAESDSNG